MERVQTRKDSVMIRSPRGQLNVTAHSGFPLENSGTHMRQEIDTSSVPSTSSSNINTDNQLVWSSPFRISLNPQITRQIAYSNCLLDMAQTAKTPLGVNPFWESGATPPREWRQWFSTLKIAIMGRDSIEVDKLLKLKPQPTDLFYPTLPTYEEEFEGETEDEARNREQRNERRRVDFENKCKVIERKGALVDRVPWDEADTKFKSLIYLSLGAEARRNYHQKNPHTQIEKCTTHELVHELNITFTIPRNTTFEFSRFKFFKSMQQSHESLETFYSRIREAGALCKIKDLEEDLVKDLFISNMTNTSIQMDLLSEVKTPQQVLNFAINRGRGQACQQDILRAHTSNTSWSKVSYIRNKPRTSFPLRTIQQPILPTPPTGKIEPCYKRGQAFIKNHLNMCKTQNFTCKICKKIGHFTSMCKAPMPEIRNTQFRQDYRKNIQQQSTPQARRVRHVKKQEKCVEEEEETEEETVDAEAALYIKELMEDWSSVNTIRPVVLRKISSISFNKDAGGECWVKAKCNNIVMDWLADTGSPQSYMEHAQAKDITNKNKASRITTFDEKSRYKYFDNQDIKVSGVLHITLKSGAWTAKNCNILLVKHLPQPVMGRDIIQQLGIYLTATKPTGKTIGLISDASTEQNIIKWISKSTHTYVRA